MKYRIYIDGEEATPEALFTLAAKESPLLGHAQCPLSAQQTLENAGYRVDLVVPARHYVGIDNGLSGGVVVLGHPHGAVLGKTIMPTRKRDGKNEVDVIALRSWLLGILGGDMLCARFFIEEPVGSKSLNAAKSMAASFHAIRGLLAAYGADWTPVKARTWQKQLFGKDKADTKELSVSLAKSLWPDEEWRKTARCTTDHDGMTDAALIAHYALNHI
jgi:hypothetical protein